MNQTEQSTGVRSSIFGAAHPESQFLKTTDILTLAAAHLHGLKGHEFDVLEVRKPISAEAAINLAKIVSKLSPIVGNLIEFNTCEYLNENPAFKDFGVWRRQDPGFPDAVFTGSVQPTPGLEVKAWFPLATEITARFKDSQNHFREDNTHVAMLAWLPEFMIFGKPHIIDIIVVSGASVSKARDDHYHNPPDYLVMEPEDTTARTANLQQTNTAGYKFQGSPDQLQIAERIVQSWGKDGLKYEPTPEYQTQLREELLNKFPYRLDTNFAKMDRIVHPEIETFKERTYATEIHGRPIREWNQLFSRGTEEAVSSILAETFMIGVDPEESVVDD